MSEKIPRRRGPKPSFPYSPEQAKSYAEENIEIGIIFPSVQDFRDDMASVAQKDSCGTAPFYNAFPEGVEQVIKLSGLEPSGLRRVASIPEKEIPRFVLNKVVSAIGQEALIGHMLENADSAFIEYLRQKINEA